MRILYSIVVGLVLIFQQIILAATDKLAAALPLNADGVKTGNLVAVQQLLAQADSKGRVSISNSQNNAQVNPINPANQTANSATTNPVNKNSVVTKSDVDPYEQSFLTVKNQLLPMDGAQIARLKEAFNSTQLAVAAPATAPPRAIYCSKEIDLAPNAVPHIIRLGAGYISSLVFMDLTGQPWPIAAYSVGDPKSFNVEWDKKSNILLIQSATFHKESNIAVILKQFNTPVVLTLIAGQQAIDYRVDLRIPGLGPNAAYSEDGLPNGVNPILFDVLNGIPPKNSQKIKVSGGECQAWLLNKKLYLRTNLHITSPSWQSRITNIDGTTAYQLQPTSVILALRKGKDITLKLDGVN